jgi:hypothetical protein
LIVEGTSGLTATLETYMKKRGLKKLHLTKETLRSMLDSELTRVAGEKASYLDTCRCTPKCTVYLNDPEGTDPFGG